MPTQNELPGIRLLLISNSGRPYFDHCRTEIADFLSDVGTTAFVTAASLTGEKEYFDAVHDSLFDQEGVRMPGDMIHLRWDQDAAASLESSEAVFVGGGNTYVLLQRLKSTGLLGLLREKICHGTRYLGSSAGANIAGPNILTSNDWNVVGLRSFSAMGLVPFNLNPHYTFRGLSEAPTSETRDDRIEEYLTARSKDVVALEEGSLLRVDPGRVTALGNGRVKVFRVGLAPRWVAAGDELDFWHLD